MMKHGSMGGPKWRVCRLVRSRLAGIRYILHPFAVFAAMVRTVFAGAKVLPFGTRTEYFLHRPAVADDLITIPQGLKRLGNPVEVIELDRSRLMPWFKKRGMYEVAHRNVVDHIFFVLDGIAHLIGVEPAVRIQRP